MINLHGMKLQSKWKDAADGRFAIDDDPDFESKLAQNWQELRKHLTYLNEDDLDFIHRALNVASAAHSGQKRKSGEDFITHPIEVAKILADHLKVDKIVLAAGLLHDTVEDCEIQFTDLEDMFGPEVRIIVEGETKACKRTQPAFRRFLNHIGQMKPGAETEDSQKARKEAQHLKNFRDMFFAIADDYRVLLVKLADRLHNMRTLEHMPNRKQVEKAKETFGIFAPLAHRSGLWSFKTELEDLSFKFLWPEAYSRLESRLDSRRRQFEKALVAAERHLNEALEEARFSAKWEITTREKGLYSLWRKMKRGKHTSIEAVKDIIAIRIVIDAERRPNESDEDYRKRTEELCYRARECAYGMAEWNGLREYEKDYIQYKKPNGYQSLHVILQQSAMDVPLEVQIRTKEMHRVAELGMAAHFAYAEMAGVGGVDLHESRETPWMATIREGQFNDPRELVEEVHKEILGTRCFVFSKDGVPIDLSKGCTVLDAACKIHSEVLFYMDYPMVNGQRVDVDYELKNGDLIHIVKAEEPRPEKDWMQKAYLNSTKRALATFFRKKTLREREEPVIDLAAGIVTGASMMAGITRLHMF